MIACPKCGAQANDNAKFCGNCRFQFSQATATQAPTCTRGHRIDPTWSECPYCRAMGPVPSALPPLPNQPMAPQHRQPQAPQAAFFSPQAALQPAPSFQTPSFQPAPAAQALSPAQSLTPAFQPRPVSIQAPQGASIPQAAFQPRAVQIQPPVQPIPLSPASTSASMSPSPSDARAQGAVCAVLATFSWNTNGNAFLLRTGEASIGRGEGVYIRVPDPSVSEKHAVLTIHPNGIFLENTSESGTFLNGEALFARIQLRNHDLIRMGETEWRIILIPQPHRPASAL